MNEEINQFNATGWRDEDDLFLNEFLQCYDENSRRLGSSTDLPSLSPSLDFNYTITIDQSPPLPIVLSTSTSSSSSSSYESQQQQQVVLQSQSRRKKNEAENNAKIKKIIGRKRKVNPAFIPSLRVLKRDIRRRYTEMYANVVNQHDPVLAERFLQEFCTASCRYRVNFPSAENISDRVGIPEILYGIVSTQLRLPDLVYLMSDSEIHVPYEQSGSTVVSTLRFKGTRVFEVQNDLLTKAFSSHKSSTEYLEGPERKSYSVVIKDNFASVSSQQTAPVTIEAKDLLLPGTIQLNSSEDYIIQHELLPRLQSLQLYPLPSPREIEIGGSFMMILDEAHRIEAFQLRIDFMKELDYK